MSAPNGCWRIVAAAAALVVAACQPPLRNVAPAATDSATARPAAAAAPAPVPAAAARSASPANVAMPNREFLAGPLYYCAVGDARAAIEYEPKVESLCRRHPEMGPCQYERNLCRAKGGRVFTARGEEVSPGVEAEYDKSVMRVRLQADGGKR